MASNPTMISIRRRLRGAVDGRIITPGNAAYDQARTLFYGGIDRRRLVIVLPHRRPRRVAGGVAGARDRTESGGSQRRPQPGRTQHHRRRHVLDLADMNALEMRPRAAQRVGADGPDRTALHHRPNATGWSTPSSRHRSVGIGGSPWAAASATWSESTASHRQPAGRRAGRRRRPLSALDDPTDRSCSGPSARRRQLRLATRFQFRLQEVSTIVCGLLLLPATPEVIAGFIAFADAAPEGLSTTPTHARAAAAVPAREQHGRLVIMATSPTRRPGGPATCGAPVAGAGHPDRRPGPADALPESYPPEEEGYQPTAVGPTCSSTPSTAPGPKRSSSTWGPRPRAMRVAQLRLLGGAMPACPPTPPRSPTEQVGSWCTWRGLPASRGGGRTPGLGRPVAARCKTWRTSAPKSLRRRGGPAGSTTPTRGRPGSGLAAIKAAYDPTNLFPLTRTFPHTVTPTTRSRRQGTVTSEPGICTAFIARDRTTLERRPT